MRATYGLRSSARSGLGAVARRRHRSALASERPLLASCVAAMPFGFGPWRLRSCAPVAVLLVPSSFAGLGLAIHIALWFTVFQRKVPEAAPLARQLLRRPRLVRAHPARRRRRPARSQR